MPKLLVFAPCEKVIISGEEVGDGSATLMSILQGLTAEISIDEDDPAELPVAAPLNWFIFVLWKTQPGDIGKRFEQENQLFSPSGKLLLQMKSVFTLEKPFQRAISRVNGMPVAETGDYTITLKLTDSGSGAVTTFEPYPIGVSHDIKPPDTKPKQVPSQNRLNRKKNKIRTKRRSETAQ